VDQRRAGLWVLAVVMVLVIVWAGFALGLLIAVVI